jgi:hypothetical protein
MGQAPIEGFLRQPQRLGIQHASDWHDAIAEKLFSKRNNIFQGHAYLLSVHIPSPREACTGVTLQNSHDGANLCKRAELE